MELAIRLFTLGCVLNDCHRAAGCSDALRLRVFIAYFSENEQLGLMLTLLFLILTKTLLHIYTGVRVFHPFLLYISSVSEMSQWNKFRWAGWSGEARRARNSLTYLKTLH